MLSDVNLITGNVNLLNLNNSYNPQIIFPLLNRKLDKVVFYWYHDIFCLCVNEEVSTIPNPKLD